MQRLGQLAALGRLGQPQDIAEVLALLVGDAADGSPDRISGSMAGLCEDGLCVAQFNRAESRDQAVSFASGRGPAASDGVTGCAVIALECALLLVEQMATVQGLDLRCRNARRVSRRYVGA